jgi:hypothetical protein
LQFDDYDASIGGLADPLMDIQEQLLLLDQAPASQHQLLPQPLLQQHQLQQLQQQQQQQQPQQESIL